MFILLLGDYMETIEKIALVFTIIGALNWGLIGIFNLNLVTLIFQEGTFLTNLIYIIIGICGAISISVLVKLFE